jgi:hypothetical protein
VRVAILVKVEVRKAVVQVARGESGRRGCVEEVKKPEVRACGVVMSVGC